MKINWFPGHMNKALKDISEQLKKVDVVTYVLDARIPLSSFNPSLDKLTQNKPTLFVLNKIDLADEKRVKDLLKQFENKNTDFVFYNSTLSGKSDIILNKIKQLAHEKVEKYLSKGVKTTVRTMVVGIPNSGKSTLVNSLCRKAKTETGDRAGVTKRGQWVSVGDCVEVYDTPGTLYPNIENQNIAKKLAYVGSVRDEILDFVEIGGAFACDIVKIYPDVLKNRYEIDSFQDGFDVLNQIAKKRKFLCSGNEIDLERAGRTIIDDFRKGRLGKLTLD